MVLAGPNEVSRLSSVLCVLVQQSPFPGPVQWVTLKETEKMPRPTLTAIVAPGRKRFQFKPWILGCTTEHLETLYLILLDLGLPRIPIPIQRLLERNHPLQCYKVPRQSVKGIMCKVRRVQTLTGSLLALMQKQ